MRTINYDFKTQFDKEEYAVAATDAKGNVINANQHFLALTGYTLDELKALAYQDITAEAWTIYENHMVIRHVFAEGYASFQKEYVTKSGEIVPVEIELFLLDEVNNGKLGIWAKVKKIDALSDEFLAIKAQSS
ncbi:MAG: PAS domain S-box-containing protein [Psychrosphaera sp.]|jgi:PAS domain S-box-containing protein|uniref:PAS domain-containing protein n=1 Tax=Psychrosphaera aquimarina TaxID=2044854 RepID=A0ABU3R0A3_9GAMM|nr:PAS domain-containing protein [Psychrosphaera aquimarina]MDU0113107.1 PAS domain-containing protein [Psychrosphaera aquimarina]